MTDWLADGTDGDLNEFGLDTTSALDELEQDVVHRISEPYGSNPDDRDRGVGVDEFLSGTPDLNGLDRAIAIDLKKDASIDSVSNVITSQTSDQTGVSYSIDTTINNTLTVTTGGGS